MFGLKERYVVGYDISTEYAQISYMEMQDSTPSTVSLTEGAEDYNIPACLFKRGEVNQWFYGREAINYCSVEDGILVENIWEHALVGDKLVVGDDEFEYVALLALFIKRSMSLLRKVAREKIAGIMFTVPQLTKRAIEILEQIVEVLGFENCKVLFEGRDESIYYYVVHQNNELWKHDVMIYDFSGRNLNGFRFSINKNTKPFVAVVDNKSHTIVKTDLNKDGAFYEVVKEDTENTIVSTSFLIGDGFDEEWCHESLKELCRGGKRVFKGNNLYSKGACYAMREKMIDSDMNQSIVFLGKDKLRANVGMKVKRVGQESYFTILDGGESWYDAKKEFDVILEQGNSFEIIITPLDGKNPREVEIVLDGLSVRERRTTRLHMKMYMESEDKLRVCATDMGFGEVYPTTYQLFTKMISL